MLPRWAPDAPDARPRWAPDARPGWASDAPALDARPGWASEDPEWAGVDIDTDDFWGNHTTPRPQEHRITGWGVVKSVFLAAMVSCALNYIIITIREE